MGSRGPARGSPPLFGTTRNGWNYSIDITFPVREQWWIIEALEACAFDPERLYASNAPLDTTGGTPGVYGRSHMTFTPAPIGSFPHAADHDYALATIAATNPPFSGWITALWDGLGSAEGPYGGERFFKETILHGLGHHVGRTIAYADMWKKQIVGAALGFSFDNPAQAEFGFLTAGDGSWAGDPEERFAEAFKDIYGARWARAFDNRTGAAVNLSVIAEECSLYWPLRGLLFKDHTSNSNYGYNAAKVADPPWWSLDFHYRGSIPQALFLAHSALAIRGVGAGSADIDREIYYMDGATKVQVLPLGRVTSDPRLFDAAFDINISPVNIAGNATDLMFDYGHNPNVSQGRHVEPVSAVMFDDYTPPAMYTLDPLRDYPLLWETVRWSAPSKGFLVDPPKTSVPRLAGYSRGER